MVRLQEFADAEEQIKLWKLISDSVWNSINRHFPDGPQEKAHWGQDCRMGWHCATGFWRAGAFSRSLTLQSGLRSARPVQKALFSRDTDANCLSVPMQGSELAVSIGSVLDNADQRCWQEYGGIGRVAPPPRPSGRWRSGHG